MALGFLVILVVALAADLRQVASNLAGFELGALPADLALTLFNYALRFIKWHYYLGLIGVRDLP